MTDEDIGEGSPTAAWTAQVPTVWVDVTALSLIKRHVSADPGRDCSGILLGRVDARTGRVAVLGAIPDGQEPGPGEELVGWYRSRSDLGTVMHSEDRRTHRERYGAPWQIAYLVDPVLAKHATFGWDTFEDEVVRLERFRTFTRKPQEARDEPPPARTVDAASLTVIKLGREGRLARMSATSFALSACVLAAIAFLCGVLLGRVLDDSVDGATLDRNPAATTPVRQGTGTPKEATSFTVDQNVWWGLDEVPFT